MLGVSIKFEGWWGSCEYCCVEKDEGYHICRQNKLNILKSKDSIALQYQQNSFPNLMLIMTKRQLFQIHRLHLHASQIITIDKVL